MGKNLVIVESPAKAKTIEKFLGKEFTVKASYGHIRDLPDGKLAVDTSGSFEPDYVVPDDKKKVVADLSAAAGKADTIWLASDEDREGEAIAWHLFDTLGLDAERTRRIVFHEITKGAILHAVENPRQIDMNLVKAQQARRILDRLVGYELSPILWRKIRRGLSAGRVQSVAVRLIVDREREIAAFNSNTYFKVEAIFTAGGKEFKAAFDHHFKSPEEARTFLESCRNARFSVADIEQKEVLRSPAPPFTTSQLQQEASRKLGFSVTQTMSTAQRLYEAGLITYMRTDSTTLSSLALATAKGCITEMYGAGYSRPRNYQTKAKGAQEAHEAIRPTNIASPHINGTVPEMKLYDLIWKRTIASQMADARIERTTATIVSDSFDGKFTAVGEKRLFDGFMKVYIESREDEEEGDSRSVLPPGLRVGTELGRSRISALETFTQGPARFSEAGLVKKLEELGIGRPSTYAPTIKTIIDRGYVTIGNRPGSERESLHIHLEGEGLKEERRREKFGAERRKFFPENIGIAVTDYLKEDFGDILDYGFTAKVEERFDLIAEGSLDWARMVGEFYGPFHEKTGHTDKGFVKKAERLLGNDPASGKPVTARIARYGAVVQLGTNDDPDKRFANLEKGQLIESITLEEALHLLILPRKVGMHDGHEITAAVGKMGPYIRYGGENGAKPSFVSIPKGLSPYTITEAEALRLIAEKSEAKASNAPILEFAAHGIQVLSGMYGPYLKHNGANYRIPKGTDPASITEEEALAIIEKGTNKKSKIKKGK